MPYVLLDFKNGLPVEALVDFRVYISALDESEKDRIKQQAPTNVFKNHEPPIFKQVAYGQLEKHIATATPKFDIGGSTFAEHFVVMKKRTGPFIGFHFMTHKKVVIDAKHDGLIHFSHLTTQVKIAESENCAKPQPVLNDENKTIPPMTKKTIDDFLDHPPERKTTCTAISLESSVKQQIC